MIELRYIDMDVHDAQQVREVSRRINVTRPNGQRVRRCIAFDLDRGWWDEMVLRVGPFTVHMTSSLAWLWPVRVFTRMRHHERLVVTDLEGNTPVYLREPLRLKTQQEAG